VPYAVTITHTP